MDKIVFFWNGFEPIWRILVVGTLTYIFIVFFLRVSGKRTLTNMNAFDFIITIAIGSSFGRILTARKVALAESFTTFALLVLLQFIVSWLEIRYKGFSRLITSQPTLLYHKGEFLYTNMRRVRIGEDKLIVAARKKRNGQRGENRGYYNGDRRTALHHPEVQCRRYVGAERSGYVMGFQSLTLNPCYYKQRGCS